MILYTSGTTSDPKGVVLTHGNFLAERRAAFQIVKLDERDAVLSVLPLFHALALLANLILPLSTGARVVNLSETDFTPGPDKTLRLDGTISRLGEGSQAARAFVGLYGGGAARAQAEMQFIDVQSKQTVLVTADRRRATMGVFGGDAKDHWKESFDDMARDLGKFLVRLAAGQAPAK